MSRPAPTNIAHLRIIPLAIVAELTGWPLRSLQDDCRDEVIDHVGRKGNYGLTPEQLDNLIARYTRKGRGTPPTAAEREADELQRAREYNAGRLTSSGRAA